MSARLYRVEIGVSQQGRPIMAAVVGSDDATVRVLVVAGQHGDEPLARAAARSLVSRLAERFVPERLAVAVVADANPDGAEAGSRGAADGTDLNRDHLLLSTPEAAAVHAFARAWRPTLCVDVHTYPARRETLLEHGLTHAADVLVDTPTHPAAVASLGADELDTLRQRVVGAVGRAGYRAGRYALLTGSGRLRHSTPDTVDLRTSLALRLGVPTLLLEGRAPARRVPGAVAERTAPALRAALDVAMRAALDGLPAAPDAEPGESVTVSTCYRKAQGRPRLPMLDATGEAADCDLPGRYRQPVASACAALPVAYAVARSAQPVLDVLARHGIVPLTDEAAHVLRGAPADALVVASVRPSTRSGRAPRRLSMTSEPVQVDDGYALFPTAGVAGRALAVWLEPEAKHGLARFLPNALALRAGARFPVLRVYAPQPCPGSAPSPSSFSSPQQARRSLRRSLESSSSAMSGT